MTEEIKAIAEREAEISRANAGISQNTDQAAAYETGFMLGFAKAYDDQKKELTKANAEIARLKAVLLNEISENDDIGAEYTYVHTLKEEIKALNEELDLAYNVQGSLVSDHDDAIEAERARSQKLVQALEFYAGWDWSDKYVQAVPKRATAALVEYHRDVKDE